MKTVKYLLLCIVLYAVGLWVMVVFADPNPPDLVITITIPGAKVQEFRAGFLAMCPVPTIVDPNWIDDPNDPNDSPIIPEFTEKQWIKLWIVRDLKRAYRHGKRRLAQQAAQIDEGICK